MVSFIEFHFNSKYLFLLILFPVFYCFREYLYSKIISIEGEENPITISQNDKRNPMLFTLIMFLGEMTSGLFELRIKD